MGAYLDRLNAQYDEINAGIDELVNRAADDERDVTDDEQKQVDRDRGRLSELETAIEHYSELEKRNAKIAALRGSVPVTPVTRSTAPAAEEYDIAREFPTPADYAITVHRAVVLHDTDAQEKLNRATAHQTTAQNPGLIPRPILGPVINLIDSNRPFINSITRRPLPTGKFDRPMITQHVLVDKQAAEKDLTASQYMKVETMPVSATTYAGHLNISRQDIKWTTPAILNIVFEDFAAMYALRTCDDASGQFIASLTNTPVDIPTADAAGVTEALYAAAAAGLSAGNALPDTLWVSPDVWATLGGMTNQYGQQSFPSLTLTGTSGNPLGLRLVVEQHFDAGTMVMGPSRFLEWYEDVDGLMQVGEPDVLGQLVGYAGFGAFLNTVPVAFSSFTFPVPVP